MRCPAHTTNPSAICVRRRWPSRVRRWHGIVRSPPRSQTSLVAHHSCSVRAAIITPVESSAAYLARFTDDSDLPRYSGGSAPTLALSRPSQCSLTLRPARSADPLRGLSIEVLQIIRRLLIRPQCFRLGRHSPVGTSTRGFSTPSQGTHNGAAERAIRPLAIGRANWLQIGGDGGLATASVLLSVCASATRHRLNPWSYLRDMLDQLANRPATAGVDDLLPDAWAQRQSAAR